MSAVGPARGVLRAAPAPGDFEHVRRAPDAALAEQVEHGWCVRWNLDGLPAQQRETLPHPNVHLVFERGATRIFGPHSARFVRRLEGNGCVVGIKFRPGGFRPYLGRAVATIADASVGLEDVFGAAADGLESRVLAAASSDAMLDVAMDFLRVHQPPADPTVAQVAAIVADVAQERSVTSVEQIVARHGIEKRALQRLFRDYVGVSPKWVVARYRLHEALAQIDAGGRVDWATLAQDLGYFDQAHFIRDFTRLVGRTPAQYATRPA